MRVITIKAYVKKKRELMFIIKENEAIVRINRERALNRSVTLSHGSGLNPSKQTHPLEASIVNKIYAEETAKSARTQLDKLTEDFKQSLLLLNKPEQSMAVTLRTVMGAKWDVVAREMGYSIRQAQRYYETAEKELEKLAAN